MSSSYLHPYASPAKTEFRTLVRAEGSCVYDDQGRRYIDGMASLWYCNAGHGQQRIIDAVNDQMNKMATYHTFDPFTNEPTEALATRIADLAPMQSPRVFLTSSGSESVDSAIKIARVAHAQRGEGDRQIIVSRDKGYHGVTYGGLSAQGLPANQEGYGPLLPDFLNLSNSDIEPIAEAFSKHGERIAAVIAEPVQGAGGVHPPTPGYLEGLRRLCDDNGAFLIFDEVICGFGRLGEWFGAQHYGITPDLITFAKGVSSGYQPLGGVVVSRKVCDALESDPNFVLRHGHTYSGHPAPSAAGLANIDVLENDGLLDRAKEIGALFENGLKSLTADGLIAGYRGDGAVWAAVLHEGQDIPGTRDRMLDHEVIGRPLSDAIGFCPPLVITDSEVGECIDAVAASVES